MVKLKTARTLMPLPNVSKGLKVSSQDAKTHIEIYSTTAVYICCSVRSNIYMSFFSLDPRSALIYEIDKMKCKNGVDKSRIIQVLELLVEELRKE